MAAYRHTQVGWQVYGLFNVSITSSDPQFAARAAEHGRDDDADGCAFLV